MAENRQHLEDPNVRAFLKAIADAEGGDYDFRYGAVKGKKTIGGDLRIFQPTRMQAKGELRLQRGCIKLPSAMKELGKYEVK